MKKIDAAEFARRGYRYGTPKESWDALERLKNAIEAKTPVDQDVVQWLTAGLNDIQFGDINGLVRRLGFHEMGRSRVVNPHDIGNRMAELVEKRGMLKAEASRQCATEFKCSPSTALAWYARRLTTGASA